MTNRFTKTLTYLDYDEENQPVEKTFTIANDSFLAEVEDKYSERYFLVNGRIINTHDAPTQFALKWDKFINFNENRLAKIISLLTREYNPLNNYEKTSTITNDIGERSTTDTMGEQTVTNDIGERKTHNAEVNTSVATFNTATANVPTGKSDNGITTMDTAQDVSTIDEVENTHVTEQTTDTTKEYTWGNIGTTMAMDMVEKEVDNRKYSILSWIIAEFINEITFY